MLLLKAYSPIFREVVFCELRRWGQPVEKVGAERKVTTNRAPEAPKSPKYGVFGSRSGVEAGREGVFQQAGVFCELRRARSLISSLYSLKCLESSSLTISP